MTRQEANLEILRHINYLIHRYPDLRFGQILWALRIIRQELNSYGLVIKDIFYEESDVTLTLVEANSELRKSANEN